MKLTILIEDLLDIELLDNEYIAHQCNASHNRAYGLASSIFKKYPKANIYSGKNKTNNRELGDIIIRDKIINIIGQKHQGKPSSDDTSNMRLNYFKSSLEKISKIEGIKRVYLPYKIGCGLAGGNWDEYLKAIKEWSNDIDFSITIIKLNEN